LPCFITIELSGIFTIMRKALMQIQYHGTLRQIIREILFENLQSHTNEPAQGEWVKNVNPQCKHFGSKGKVVSMQNLPDDAGTTVKYLVVNTGENYSPGDILEKTLDQIAFMEQGHQ
jgi:hypothetical protein